MEAEIGVVSPYLIYLIERTPRSGHRAYLLHPACARYTLPRSLSRSLLRLPELPCREARHSCWSVIGRHAKARCLDITQLCAPPLKRGAKKSTPRRAKRYSDQHLAHTPINIAWARHASPLRNFSQSMALSGFPAVGQAVLFARRGGSPEM